MRRIKPLVRCFATMPVRIVMVTASLLSSSAVSVSYCLAQQVTHPLPQARPGTHYSAQLAIPPGLGYPFAHCELQGQTPRWLTIDCARLQIKGKVPPAPPNADATYRVTLRLEDQSGNTRSFALQLRVSAAPQVVSLEDDSPRPASPSATPAVTGTLTDGTLKPTVQARPETAEQGTGTATAMNTLEVPRQPEKGQEVANPESPASDLSSAVAQLRPATIQSGTRRTSRSPNPSITASSGLHAYAGTAPNCDLHPPQPGAAASKEDQDTITTLAKAAAECKGTKAAPCDAALKLLQDELPRTIADLNDCAENGRYIKAAGAKTADVETAQKWYRGRAALWQQVVDDMVDQKTAVDAGTYRLPDTTSEVLLNPAGDSDTPPAVIDSPVIVGALHDGAATLDVQASNGVDLSLYSIPVYDPKTRKSRLLDQQVSVCTSQDIHAGTLVPLKTSATDATVITRVLTSFKKGVTSGVQTIYLQQSLTAGTLLCASASVPTKTGQTAQPEKLSNLTSVEDTLDWGRVRAYFVGGVLISNTQNSFSSSSANQFLDLNIDKFWHVPYCAITLKPDGGCAQPTLSHRVGFSTYFDTRLTAIPVSATTTTTTLSTANTPTISTALTTQKTAKVQVGAYLPILVATWNYNRSGNALYFGPIAKVGFDTITGSTTPSTTLNANSTNPAPTNVVQQTQQLDRVYNFYSFGARVGHFGLYPSPSKSPELLSYLDINFGPYSNLESYICEQSRPWAPVSPTTVSACGQGPLANLPYASEKRIWRLDLEGLLKVPSTPIVIGFNANIGQQAVGAKNIDTKRIPADDVRFLFGTKFDVATVMKKLGVGQ